MPAIPTCSYGLDARTLKCRKVRKQRNKKNLTVVKSDNWLSRCAPKLLVSCGNDLSFRAAVLPEPC